MLKEAVAVPSLYPHPHFVAFLAWWSRNCELQRETAFVEAADFQGKHGLSPRVWLKCARSIRGKTGVGRAFVGAPAFRPRRPSDLGPPRRSLPVLSATQVTRSARNGAYWLGPASRCLPGRLCRASGDSTVHTADAAWTVLARELPRSALNHVPNRPDSRRVDLDAQLSENRDKPVRPEGFEGLLRLPYLEHLDLAVCFESRVVQPPGRFALPRRIVPTYRLVVFAGVNPWCLQ